MSKLLLLILVSLGLFSCAANTINTNQSESLREPAGDLVDSDHISALNKRVSFTIKKTITLQPKKNSIMLSKESENSVYAGVKILNERLEFLQEKYLTRTEEERLEANALSRKEAYRLGFERHLKEGRKLKVYFVTKQSDINRGDSAHTSTIVLKTDDPSNQIRVLLYVRPTENMTIGELKQALSEYFTIDLKPPIEL